jgi:hypothetical protein
MHGQGHLRNTATVGWSWHWLIFAKCLVQILTGRLIIITGFYGFSWFVRTYAKTIPLIRPWPLVTAFRIHYLLSCSQDTLFSLKVIDSALLSKPQINEKYVGFESVIAVLVKIQVVKPWTVHTLKMESAGPRLCTYRHDVIFPTA